MASSRARTLQHAACLAAATALWAGAALAQKPERVGYSGPAPTDRTPASLYKSYCANCHGAAMAGDGPVAARLPFPVRDLRAGMRLSGAADPHPFTAADVAQVTERGVPDTAMPAFAGVFTRNELSALSRHVLSLVKADPGAPLLDLGPALDATPDNVMEGAAVYARAGCATCHGLDGRGGPDPAIQKKNDDGTPARWPRLDRPVTWRGGAGAREIGLRIARGMPGTPMPAYRPALRDRDIQQLALYVETMAEGATARSLAEAWVQKPDEREPAVRGEHLLRTMNCAWCHRAGAGPAGTRVDVGPLGAFHAGPLLPPEAAADRATAKDALLEALLNGRGTDGRLLMPLAHPWPHMGALTESDIDGIAAALLARPRAAAAGAPPRPASWAEQLGGKLSAVAKLTVLEMKIAPADGSADDGGPSPRLVAAAVVAVAAAAWVFLLMLALGGPKRGRSRRTVVAFFPLPLGVALGLLMLWPAYDLRPASTVRLGMAADLPAPQGLAGEGARQLAERGRTLVAQAGCAVCHTAQNPYRLAPSDALAGGARLRGKDFGRVYAANLTGHEATGLGSATPEQIKRALRGGIGRDGRVMHPDAMPYYLSAAWTEDELEAVVTYLKAVPPTAHKIPAHEPVDDLEGVALGLFDEGL